MVSTASIWRRLPADLLLPARPRTSSRTEPKTAIEPAGGEPLVEAVAEGGVLAGVEEVEPLAEACDDLVEVRHPAAAELGDEDLARVGAQLAAPLLEDRRRAEPERGDVDRRVVAGPSVRSQSQAARDTGAPM